MDEPQASRPYMPGYGILGATEGRGLLSWSWAEERLSASHDYWVASRWPDGLTEDDFSGSPTRSTFPR